MRDGGTQQVKEVEGVGSLEVWERVRGAPRILSYFLHEESGT